MRTKMLSPVQMMTFTTAATMGVDVLIAQRQMVSIAGHDAWISLSLGGLLAIISGTLVYFLTTLYPGKDLPQIIIHIGGKFVGRLLLIPSVVYVPLYAVLSIRIFAQTLKVFLLDRTPIFAIVILMTIVTTYCVYHGIYTIGGILDILFPLGKITIISLIVLSFNILDPSRLKPILFENTAGVLKGIIPGFQQFNGIAVISYILCYTQQSKGRFKWYIIGLGITVILYIALTLICIMVFGAPGILSLNYPTLALSKSIEFPLTFLERLESFTTVLWISIVFESLLIFLFASVRNFTVFLGLEQKHQKYVVYGHIPLIIALALAVKPAYKVIEYFELIKNIHVFNGLIFIPSLLGFTLIIRRKKEKSR